MRLLLWRKRAIFEGFAKSKGDRPLYSSSFSDRTFNTLDTSHVATLAFFAFLAVQETGLRVSFSDSTRQ